MVAFLIAGIGAASGAGAAPVFTTLYTFSGGANPLGRLSIDSGGNLYGTTCGVGTDCGVTNGPVATAFELSPPSGTATAWTKTTLYKFGPSVTLPAGLTLNARGRLFGVSGGGGSKGGGFVFRLTPPANGVGPWTKTTLFDYGESAANSSVDLVFGTDGGLYGALNGGTNDYGRIMELSPPPGGGVPWDRTIIENFGAAPDQGLQPATDRLAVDAAGNLYGTAHDFDAFETDVVFELVRPTSDKGTWVTQVLSSFSGPDSDVPASLNGVVFDAYGNLYGTSQIGGPSEDGLIGAYGTVFELFASAGSGTPWVGRTAYNFTGGADGSNPLAEPVMDRNGNFYGTASRGGAQGFGTVFELNPTFEATGAGTIQTGWNFQVLYTFTGGADGGFPASALVMDAKGTLYGTTSGELRVTSHPLRRRLGGVFFAARFAAAAVGIA